MYKNIVKKSAPAVLALAVIWLAGFFVRTAQADELKQQMLVDKARITLQEFLASNDTAWIREHLREAKGVVIVPEWWQGGVVLGGSGGYAVLLGRDEKTGEWSQPVFFKIAGGLVGLLIGGEKSAVLMTIRTDRGLYAFYKTDFKIGEDISAAAGPKGAGEKKGAEGDIVSFSHSKGLYAGVSLEGVSVKIDAKGTFEYYGKEVSARDIIVRKLVSNPGSAELREDLRKAANLGSAKAER